MDQLKMMDFWMKYKPLPHFFKKLHLNRVDWVWFDFSRHFVFNVPVEKKSESILKQMANVLI